MNLGKKRGSHEPRLREPPMGNTNRCEDMFCWKRKGKNDTRREKERETETEIKEGWLHPTTTFQRFQLIFMDRQGGPHPSFVEYEMTQEGKQKDWQWEGGKDKETENEYKKEQIANKERERERENDIRETFWVLAVLTLPPATVQRCSQCINSDGRFPLCQYLQRVMSDHKELRAFHQHSSSKTVASSH